MGEIVANEDLSETYKRTCAECGLLFSEHIKFDFEMENSTYLICPRAVAEWIKSWGK